MPPGREATTLVAMKKRALLAALAAGEGMFVFTPARGNVGVAVGPMLELPMSGTYKSERTQGAVTTTTEVSAKITNFGAVAGIAAAF